VLNTSVDSTGSLDNDLSAFYDDYAQVNGQNNVIGQEELLNTSFQSVESMDSTATSGADLTFGSECSQAQVHFCTRKDLGVLLQLAENLQMDYLSSKYVGDTILHTCSYACAHVLTSNSCFYSVLWTAAFSVALLLCCLNYHSIHSARKSGKRDILIINQHHLMKYHKRYIDLCV